MAASEQVVGDEFRQRGRAAIFSRIEEYLSDSKKSPAYAELANQLDTTESAMRVILSRARSRHREVLGTMLTQAA